MLCSKQTNIKKNFSVQGIRVLNLLLKELELKSKSRSINGYKNMSIGKLSSILDKSEPRKKTKAIRDIRTFNTVKIPKNKRNFFRLEKDKNIKH